MDPNQALRDLFDLVVELGHGDTKSANLRKLAQIADTANNMYEWVDAGGFMPKIDLTTPTP